MLRSPHFCFGTLDAWTWIILQPSGLLAKDERARLLKASMKLAMA
jgi:hypothetical protein